MKACRAPNCISFEGGTTATPQRELEIYIALGPELSLTPALSRWTSRTIDISRFNGLRSDRDVCAFLISLLGSPDLGNAESRETTQQNRSSPCVSLPRGLRRKGGHLHEDQFCKCRSCSCAN